MKLRPLSVIVFLIISFGATAQTKRIEFLQKAIQNSRSDNESADLYNELAEKISVYDLERGFTHAQKSLKLSTENKYTKGVARALTTLGTFHYYKGDNSTARSFYSQALAAAANQRIDDYPIRTYFRLAILYRQQAYFDTAALYLDKADALLPKETGALHGQAFAIRGILANLMNRNEEALALLKKSIAIRKSLPDSLRLADTWRNLGAVYTDVSMYDSAEYCYQEASAVLGDSKDPEINMLLNLSRGETNFERGNHKEAAKNYNDALNNVKTNTYKRYYSYLLFKIGELYESQGEYNTAYEYLFGALNEFESINDRQDMAKVYSQIGWCYNYQENYTLARENGEKALTIAGEIGDSSSIAQNRNLIGYALLKSNKYDEALVNLNEALRIRKAIKHWWGVTYTLYNSALTYEQLGQRDQAFKLLNESLELNERIGNQSGIVFVCNEIGLLYAKNKQYDKAELYLKRAHDLAKKISLSAQLVANYKNYIFLYESKGDSRSTIQYFKRYVSLKDSLGSELGSSRMAKADAMFQLQKKAGEIQLKNRENELQQERISAQEGVISMQQLVLTIVAISLVALAILLVVIYRLLRARTRAREVLRRQNKEIYEQKEEIQAQSEELSESNSQLISLNSELTEKNHEIEVQSENILEANSNLEKRVEERTRQLNTAYKELETFFYKTSHDFRRPLTAYLGLAEIAKVSVQDKHALELFEKVRETTLGLDNMLVKLQSISNIDYESQTHEISVPELIDQSLNRFKSAIEARGIRISVDNLAGTVRTNAHLCRVFIDSILENSIDYSRPAEPCITIHTSQNDKSISFTFQDNGSGIPPGIQHRIFEMYYRGSDNSKGNGLGLYIAKRAVEKLGGTISLESKVNEGTSFTVVVPVGDR
ncbi:MAG: tetratricopeptide repeat protein [Chryseolinea sp.]